MKRAAHLLSTVGQCLWRLPSAFDLVNVLGRDYGVRCVLFHDVADQRSAFTDGLKVTIDRWLSNEPSRSLPSTTSRSRSTSFRLSIAGSCPTSCRSLVTFDDAYATIAENAAPICQKYGVPAVFFLNASLVDNRDLSLENFLRTSGILKAPNRFEPSLPGSPLNTRYAKTDSRKGLVDLSPSSACKLGSTSRRS